MFHCPNEDIPITETGTFCSKLDPVPRLRQLAATSLPELTPSSESPLYPPRKHNLGTFATLGSISAFLSLFIIPEIFGSAAIILGAYTWRMERDDSRNRGLFVLIIGIIFMIVGIYTGYFTLGDLIPS